MRQIICSLSETKNQKRGKCYIFNCVYDYRKFDSLTLDSETGEKGKHNCTENCIIDDTVEKDTTENQNKTQNCTTTTQTSNDSPVNPSVDSSTDTLIPSNDSLLDTIDKET